MAGTSICLRRVETAAIYDAIARHHVSHLCGAPIVMQMVLAGDDRQRRSFDHQVNMLTAAAPPPAPVLRAMAEAGFQVTHVYGLTEIYGPAVVCEWRDEWNALPMEEQAALKARQGVPYPVQEGLMVADAETMVPVPRDGATLGEVFLRGNLVMKGYLKNPKATEESFAGGWFHSGDLAVWHPDGYIELKDRSKDIIISGGENISSIEVESVLYEHPAVAAAAVVAKPSEKWGETPCAFVELKPGAQGDRGGTDPVLPRSAGALQVSARRGVRRPAEDLDREDPEVRAARPGARGVNSPRGAASGCGTGWCRRWRRCRPASVEPRPPDSARRRDAHGLSAMYLPMREILSSWKTEDPCLPLTALYRVAARNRGALLGDDLSRAGGHGVPSSILSCAARPGVARPPRSPALRLAARGVAGAHGLRRHGATVRRRSRCSPPRPGSRSCAG